MRGEDYGLLDPSDPAQVAEYEHYFYLAYAGLADNTLVRLIWDFDDDRQHLRARVPYRDQVIYRWRDADDRLVVAMAVNVNTGRGSQSAAFGFAPPVTPPERTAPELRAGRTCEILNVMTTVHHHGWGLASYCSFIRDFGYGDLVKRGFDIAYSTCTRRRLRSYLRLGAKLLNQAVVNGEDRYHLSWPIRELVADGLAAEALRGRPTTVSSTSACQPSSMPNKEHI
jgi:hypothetical protein